MFWYSLFQIPQYMDLFRDQVQDPGFHKYTHTHTHTHTHIHTHTQYQVQNGEESNGKTKNG